MGYRVLGFLFAVAIAPAAEASRVLFDVRPLNSSYTSFGVYATVSAGDNLGLAAFKFTFGPNTSAFVNASPYGRYIPTTDATVELGEQNTGFSLLRSAGGSADVTGAQNTPGAPELIRYGIGQQSGTVALPTTPDGYVLASNSRLTYGYPVLLATCSFVQPLRDYFVGPALSNISATTFTSSGPITTESADVSYSTVIPEPVGVSLLAGLAGGAVLARRRRPSAASVA